MDRLLNVRKPKFARAAVVGAAVLLLTLFLAGLFAHSKSQATEFNLVVRSELIQTRVSGRASIVPQNEVLVSAPTEGPVVEKRVDVGTVVERGDVLMELGAAQAQERLEDLQQELAIAKAEAATLALAAQTAGAENKSSLRRAKRTAEIARATLDAEAQLHARQIISSLQLMRTKLELEGAVEEVETLQIALDKLVEQQAAEREMAQLKVKTAQRNVQRQEAAIAALTVRAPIDGVVTTVSVAVGEVVVPDTPLVTLASSKRVARIEVSESDAPQLSKGLEVVLSSPTGSVTAVIESISAASTSGVVSVLASPVGDWPDWVRHNNTFDAAIATRVAETLVVNAVEGLPMRIPVQMNVRRTGRKPFVTTIYLEPGDSGDAVIRRGDLSEGDTLLSIAAS